MTDVPRLPPEMVKDHYADISDLSARSTFRRAYRWRMDAAREIAAGLVAHCPKGATLYPYAADSGSIKAPTNIAEAISELRPDVSVALPGQMPGSDVAKPIFVTLHVDGSDEHVSLVSQYPHATFLAYSQRNRAAYIMAREMLANRPLVTEEHVYDALLALYSEQNDDAVLFEGIRLIQSHSVISSHLAEPVISEISGLFMDSPHAGLASMMRESYDKTHQLHLKSALSGAQNGSLTGVQLLNSSETQAVVFLPDASEPGRFRVSYFDKRGFFSHSTRDTYQELLDMVWQDGFRPNENNPNPMVEWSQHAEWVKGTELTLAIQQVNLGKLSHDGYIGLAQWQAHGELIKNIALSVKSTFLEPAQRERMIQEQCQKEIGFSLSDDAVRSLSQNPHVDPILNGPLFAPKVEPDAPMRSELQTSENKSQRKLR